ncbi:MAG: glutamate--cysteine ligase [Rhodospirillales bacterium]|nr:glutamate--cysteine ligase [Rhodospirillales bacterium]
MSAPPSTRGATIASKSQLVEYIAEGSKPEAAWRIGTEHEKFVFRLADHYPVGYDGPQGIRALLEGMQRFGWEPVYENDQPVALLQGLCSITLEPGGQFELSGAPLETIHETCSEVNGHLRQVREVAGELGIGMIGLGFEPKWTRADMQFMPKARSDIMRHYMPKVGSMGLDMMHRTCTVQVNLDFSSEADMVKKFRTSLALQPVATALFANSPFSEGKPNGFLSYRSHVWTDTDNDRSGMLPFVFEDGFGFERYVDYLLDVPMYFVYRDGKYIDAAGQSFRDFIAGRLPALPGELPHMGDWSDHLTTAFPEVRLKKFLEMRGADGGPWRRLCALPALWVGLLYDAQALDAAAQLVKDWTVEEITQLRASVPRRGLAVPFRGRTLREVALDMLAIARDGLHRRARRNNVGDDEGFFLDTLFQIAGSGRTPAEELLSDYETKWNRSVDPVFTDYAY